MIQLIETTIGDTYSRHLTRDNSRRQLSETTLGDNSRRQLSETKSLYLHIDKIDSI